MKNIVAFELEPTKGQQFRCTICGKKAEYYYKGKGLRHWRVLDLGTTQILIESEAPRVKCKIHGVHTAKVPWARHHSTFTRDFEDTVAWLSLHCSRKTVAEFMRISWNTVGPIISRCKKDADSHPKIRFNNLKTEKQKSKIDFIARIEAMNNNIKLTIRMTYGFRNIGNMIDMIMLRCSHIPIFLPGRPFGAHTY